MIGPLARYVGDLYPILQIIEGPDHVDPALVPMPLGDPAEVDLSQLRVAFYDYDGYREATEATRSVVRAAAAAVDGFVLAVDEGRPAGIERSLDVWAGLFYADGGAMADRLRAAAGQQPLSDQHAVGLGGDELDALFDAWYSLRQEMSGFFADHDVAICPVHTQPAPLHGELSPQDASYTMAYNLTGWPVAVVRAGTSAEGLPIGVQIVAAPGREDIALAVAGLIESELGGFHPPTL